MDIIDRWEKRVADGSDFYYDEITIRISPTDADKIQIRIDE